MPATITHGLTITLTVATGTLLLFEGLAIKPTRKR
jgi:hypothetical protein